jgi:hypothetical protein
MPGLGQGLAAVENRHGTALPEFCTCCATFALLYIIVALPFYSFAAPYEAG